MHFDNSVGPRNLRGVIPEGVTPRLGVLSTLEKIEQRITDSICAMYTCGYSVAEVSREMAGLFKARQFPLALRGYYRACDPYMLSAFVHVAARVTDRPLRVKEIGPGRTFALAESGGWDKYVGSPHLARLLSRCFESHVEIVGSERCFRTFAGLFYACSDGIVRVGPTEAYLTRLDLSPTVGKNRAAALEGFSVLDNESRLLVPAVLSKLEEKSDVDVMLLVKRQMAGLKRLHPHLTWSEGNFGPYLLLDAEPVIERSLFGIEFRQGWVGVENMKPDEKFDFIFARYLEPGAIDDRLIQAVERQLNPEGMAILNAGSSPSMIVRSIESTEPSLPPRSLSAHHTEVNALLGNRAKEFEVRVGRQAREDLETVGKTFSTILYTTS